MYKSLTNLIAAAALPLVLLLATHAGAQVGREIKTPLRDKTAAGIPPREATASDEIQAKVVVMGTYCRLLLRAPSATELRGQCDRLLKGEIDEVGLWDELLGSAERRELFAAHKKWARACLPPAALLFGVVFYLLMGAKPRMREGGWLLLSLVFGTVFLAMTGIYSVNIPYWDDYDAVLEYLCRAPADRLGVSSLIAQHNEHRIVFSRLSILASYLLTGGVMDFRVMALVGALPVLGAGLLIHLMARTAGVPSAVCPIIVMGVFSMRTNENITWGMSSTQHSAVVFFALLCLWLWSRRTHTSRVCSLAALVASSFSSPSGVLLCPVLIAWTLLEAFVPRDGEASR